MMRQCFVYLYAQTLYDTTLLCPTPHYTVLHYTTPHSILHRPRERLPDQRRKVEWAWCVKELLDVYYPDALKIRSVCDNLNTHTGGALDEAFPPKEAKRLWNRLEFHPTPKHGGWLNIAETELSVLSEQCL